MKRIACCLLALVACAGAAPRDEDDATRAFRRDYPAASARIVAAYEQVRIDGKQSFEDGRVEAWSFARSGRSTRFESVDATTGAGFALVADPGHSFRLDRDPGADGYAVTSQTRGGVADPDTPKYVDAIEARTPPAFVPYRGDFARPIAGLLADKNFAIKAIAHVGVAPDRIVRVDWELAPARPRSPASYGTFEFLPDSAWVLRSCSLYLRDQGKDPATGESLDVGRGADLEYRGEHAGIPLVRRVTTWTSARGRGTGPTYEVTRIVPGLIPRSEFAIESFPITPAPAAKP